MRSRMHDMQFDPLSVDFPSWHEINLDTSHGKLSWLLLLYELMKKSRYFKNGKRNGKQMNAKKGFNETVK